jgi:hypothetical protein
MRHAKLVPGRRPIAASALVTAVGAALMALAPPASARTIAVNCQSQSLQARINAAPAGSTLLVKGTCVGNFTLGKSLTLQGNPAATLDGNHAGTTLTIKNTPTVHLVGLTITRGLAAEGGGINQAAGKLTLVRVQVSDNFAIDHFGAGGGIWSGAGSVVITSSAVNGNVAYATVPPLASAQGGGIYSSSGSVSITRSSVNGNRAEGSGESSTAEGGAIFSDGTLTITSSNVDGNAATAGPTGAGFANGGAIRGRGVTVTASTFTGDSAEATDTGSDQAAVQGGAISLIKGAPLARISSSAFTNDRAVAKSAGGQVFADGGAIQVTNSSVGLRLVGSHVTGAQLRASGGSLVDAHGGAVAAQSPLTMIGSSVTGSTIVGTAGTDTLDVEGGGIAGTSATIARSTIADNHLSGTSASSDATAIGGGGRFTDTFVMSASTVSGNTVDATAGAGSTASAHAGGVQVTGTSTANKVTNSTIAGNAVHGHGPTAFAAGGGLESTASSLAVVDSTIARNASGERGGGILAGGPALSIEATIVALNTAPTGPDCRGTVTSAGHNLVGKTAPDCNFTPQPSDKLHVDPKLAALAANGGPTRTMALLLHSPALNAIPKAACAVKVDQRGVSRPQGPGCDIGAYERTT